MAKWFDVLESLAVAIAGSEDAAPGRSRRSRDSNECEYWNCDKRIKSDFYLCYDHFRQHKQGKIDECPVCESFKDARYEKCRDCNGNPSSTNTKKLTKNRTAISNGGVVRESRKYQKEYSPAWSSGDATAKVFHVYILKLDGGDFYAGQTRELRARLSEHRDGRVKSTVGRNPKLVWFTELATRDDATELEVELKKVIDKNQRVIRKLVTDFHDLVRELDFS